jgi:hypothetical protein
MSSTDARISALGEDSPSPFTALTATSVTLTSGDRGGCQASELVHC